MAFRKSRRLRRNTKKSRKNYRGGVVPYDEKLENKKNKIAWYVELFKLAIIKEKGLLIKDEFLTKSEIPSVTESLKEAELRAGSDLPKIRYEMNKYLERYGDQVNKLLYKNIFKSYNPVENQQQLENFHIEFPKLRAEIYEFQKRINEIQQTEEGEPGEQEEYEARVTKLRIELAKLIDERYTKHTKLYP
jgi:hypothetical protein